MIDVKCFGVAKEIVEESSTSVDLKSISVNALRLLLNEKFESFSSIKGYMIAVNQEYATDDMIINEGDEVAIIPPVSGG